LRPQNNQRREQQQQNQCDHSRRFGDVPPAAIALSPSVAAPEFHQTRHQLTGFVSWTTSLARSERWGPPRASRSSKGPGPMPRRKTLRRRSSVARRLDGLDAKSKQDWPRLSPGGRRFDGDIPRQQGAENNREGVARAHCESTCGIVYVVHPCDVGIDAASAIEQQSTVLPAVPEPEDQLHDAVVASVRQFWRSRCLGPAAAGPGRSAGRD